MSKRHVHITSLSDLEREERNVRQRLKQQEAELGLRIKKLPEEIVTAAIIRLVSSVLKGDTLNSVVNFAKKVGKNALSGLFKDIL